MWPMIAATAISGIGSYFSSKSAGKAQKAAADAYIAASQQLASLTPPQIANLIEPYQQAVWLGQLTPEDAVAKIIEETAYSGIQTPPELQQAQYDALRQIKEIADSGGLTAQDRAQIEDIRRETGTMERGARQAIMSNLQARGIAGGGSELAMKAIAQQQGANRAAKAGTDIAALAQQRSLQAIAESGKLAGNIRGQEFSEQERIAAAKDAMAKMNANILNQAEMANVAARNRAAEQAQGRQYDIQNQNIAQKTAEQNARIAATQQDWANRFGQASAVAGRSGATANYLGGLASNAQAAAQAGRGEAVSQFGDLISQILKEQEKNKGASGGGMVGDFGNTYSGGGTDFA